MFNKTITTEFFTTINFNIFIKTLWLLTYNLPFLRKWSYISYVEHELLSYIWVNSSKIISFYNWRSAIYHALEMIWVTNTDEVVVSWYTCVSVSNAVIQSGAKIVYSDIDSSNLWLSISELEKNINNNTRVIIIQHTFWKPAMIDEIIELAKKRNILVIEDCALSLWSRVNEKKLWSFWDFSVFSTWRDKVISSVTWGFLIINNKSYFEKTESITNNQVMPSRTLVIKNLLYNIIGYISYKTYDFFKLGRVIIYLARKCWIITQILTKSEKNSDFNKFNYKLPNSLAFLASSELEKIKFICTYRKSLWEYYNDEINSKYFKPLFQKIDTETNNYFRYPILIESEKTKNDLYKYMRKNNIILWNTWSWTNIVPVWSDLEKAKYIPGSCPVAEDISKRILNLPGHKKTNENDIHKVLKLLNNYKK